MLRVALAAAAAGMVGAVTDETNTPTSASNYMVMQGDISYTSTASTSFGGIDGRIQMVRSALTATTSFSYSLHFAQSGSAPAPGTVVTAHLGRHVCAVGFTAYQDPYECPGYVLSTNTNSCPSSQSVEVAIPCTVDANGACVGTYDWGIYIPEVFEGQQLEDMSLYFSTSSGTFACGNFGASRILAVGESADPRNTDDSEGNTPLVIVGEVEKDELGYTHVEVDFDSMSGGADYTLEVASAPCSTLDDTFSAGSAIMSHSFTSDSDGTAEVAFYSPTIQPASTGSLVLRENGDVVKCFALEIGMASIQSRITDALVNDGCAAWADFYTVGDLGGNKGPKKGKGLFSLYESTFGKGKGGKSLSRSGKGRNSLDSAFQSVMVDSTPRCCILPDAVDREAESDCLGRQGKSGKCRGRSGGLFAVSESRKAQTGLGAGIAGAIILAAGVAMHVRRRARQADVEELTEAAPHDVISEKTPLTVGAH